MNLLEKAKKIHAAPSFAALRAPKLNFPMAMAKVFWTVWLMSRKFRRFALRMKKKKQQNEPKTMTNSTTKVERPMKQSLIVAAICLKAFWKLRSRQNLSMLVKTVKETV